MVNVTASRQRGPGSRPITDYFFFFFFNFSKLKKIYILMYIYLFLVVYNANS